MSLILIIILSSAVFSQEVLSGADVLLNQHQELLNRKRIGIVTNHTAVLKNGTHLVDALIKIEGINVTTLFGPEHGIRGAAPAGVHVQSGIDDATKLPVYSLYGQTKKPTAEMLKDVDILIFDIQDVGARFYTYISTLFYTIEAGCEFNIPIIVLDRPNPISGLWVDGPVRNNQLKSFVGIAPIPIIHGMTIGELANYFLGEGLIKANPSAPLTVIKISNWKREMFFDETNLTWTNPSPNIPNFETALVYPGTCLIEGTNISEGRGTFEPFVTIGSPFINADDVIREFKKYGHAGIKLSKVTFTPQEIPNMAAKPKFSGVKCNGIKITVSDRNELKPVEFGITLISILNKLYKSKFEFKTKSFDLLAGNSSIRLQIENGIEPALIISSYKKELEDFKLIRNKYLLY